MTPQKRHDGDCNMTIENKQDDPPVRNSLFIGILLAIVGALMIGLATVVYSQVQSDRKEQAISLKEQIDKNAAQEIRIVQLETAFIYIKQSLDKIESNTKTTADKVERLEQRMKK